MKIMLLSTSILIQMNALAQQQTYDLLSYTPPKGWETEKRTNVISYYTTNLNDKTWCRISIVKSTASTGSWEADFLSEWKELAVKPYKANEVPLAVDTQTYEGWKIKSGMGKFTFNNDTASILLNTFSNNQRNPGRLGGGIQK